MMRFTPLIPAKVWRSNCFARESRQKENGDPDLHILFCKGWIPASDLGFTRDRHRIAQVGNSRLAMGMSGGGRLPLQFQFIAL
jgi:hypothetical protein